MKQLAFLMLLFVAGGLFAQVFEKNINGSFKGFLKENIPQTVTQGEIWAVPAVPAGNPFFIGWELEVVIPSEGVKRGANFMASFYSSPRPYPHEQVASYRVWDKGTKVLNTGRVFNFQILDTDWAPRNQWQVVTLRAGEYPLLFVLEPSFQSSYKEETASNFLVKIKPIYNEQGIINFELFDEETKERVAKAQITLGGKTYNLPATETLFQEKGIYTALIKGEGYEEKNVQVQVEPGRENSVSVPLKKSRTELLFNVANMVEILLDGRAVVGDERQKGAAVEPGSHTVTLILGSYTMSRTLYVQAGKKYQVDFTLSLDFNEVP